MVQDVYIVAACRTGIGSTDGQFSTIPATILGATVIRNCIFRADISASDISEVIMGQVLTAGQGQNPARQAAIHADIPLTIPAYTINMLSASGLKTVHLGYQAIRNGDAKLVVCGGQENMSLAEHSVYIRDNFSEEIKVQDTILIDGLTDAFTNLQINEIAEYFANINNISREIQDAYALQSHLKAAKATVNNDFIQEIVPVLWDSLNLENDELVRFDMSLKDLQETLPSFEEDVVQNSTITERNSSANADGAAALILCSEEQLKCKDLVVLARIVSFAQVAHEPTNIGLGQVHAIEKVLSTANWNKDEVDLYEIDETFASQTLFVIKQLALKCNRCNVVGGSIALGLPLAVNGARLLVTLLHNLHRLGLNKGIACVDSGGMSLAIAVDRP